MINMKRKEEESGKGEEGSKKGQGKNIGFANQVNQVMALRKQKDKQSK